MSNYILILTILFSNGGMSGSMGSSVAMAAMPTKESCERIGTENTKKHRNVSVSYQCKPIYKPLFK